MGFWIQVLACLRRDPAFTDAGAPEPPAELLILRAQKRYALDLIDKLIAEERADDQGSDWLIDALLEVRLTIAPGTSKLRHAVPVIPGRTS